MKKVSKVLVMMILMTMVLAMSVEARVMKRTKEQVKQPQNFYGGAGGAFFPGSGAPGIVSGIGFSPSGVCTLPSGGCIPTSGGFPTIPGGGSGHSGGPIIGTGSVPMIPHN